MTKSSQVPQKSKKKPPPTGIILGTLLVVLAFGYWLSISQRSISKAKAAPNATLDLPSAVVPQPTMQPVMVNENPFPAAPARLRD